MTARPTPRVVSPGVDHLAHLAQESERFALAIAQAGRHERVPTCPAWDADDLLWHLGEVQWFWGTIVREGLTGPQAQELKPGRPASRARLLDFFAGASAELHRALSEVDAAAPAWTWAPEQTVGFIRRRQAQEVLMHRLDAELTAGLRTPMDPDLCSDGIDEALRVMYGGVPDWGAFTEAPEQTIRLVATDTRATWLATLGRFSGTDPEDGTEYDEPDLHPVDADHQLTAAVTVTGRSEDLDCLLWHRPRVQEPQIAGDHAVASAFRAVLARGID